ncbi:Alcohol dehydrogenase-like 3 [Acorus calamus]|uniref:Alcohol dehydrogenase-like 3 n=1 Tax=Acorus calamus TaxID=4465 RepID=A0AAV9DR55_ACOCL|nr:Alcohol dehydrogenase-like 3 [Acorus calamus]
MGSLHEESSNGYHANNTNGKIITCKAAVLWGPKEAFKIEEVEVHPPQKTEVRIKIVCTTICHSDLGAWIAMNKEHWAFPRILGHEAAGIVESVGEGVLDLSEGDHVVPIFNGECGDCVYCKSSKTNLCERYRADPLRSVMIGDGKTRFFTKNGGQPIHHFLNISSFTEYTVLESACVVKINPKAPLEKMSLLGCGISTGVGAAWNTADVKKGSSVAVFGLGSVGLAVAEGARVRGASKIIGVDVNPEKFVNGRVMGVTEFVNPKNYETPVHEVIRKMTKGGVDFSFECAGNVDVLREAFLSTHDGWGLTVVLGIHEAQQRCLFIRWNYLKGGGSLDPYLEISKGNLSFQFLLTDAWMGKSTWKDLSHISCHLLRSTRRLSFSRRESA